MVFDKWYLIIGFDKVYLIKGISAVTNYNSSSCFNSINRKKIALTKVFLLKANTLVAPKNQENT